MKTNFLLFPMSFSIVSYAQVGIGKSTPSASTQLVMAPSNKGAKDVATIANPASGLFYVTAIVTATSWFN